MAAAGSERRRGGRSPTGTASGGKTQKRESRWRWAGLPLPYKEKDVDFQRALPSLQGARFPVCTPLHRREVLEAAPRNRALRDLSFCLPLPGDHVYTQVCRVTGHRGPEEGPLAGGPGPAFWRYDVGDESGCGVLSCPCGFPFSMSLGTLPGPNHPTWDPVFKSSMSIVLSALAVSVILLSLDCLRDKSKSSWVFSAPPYPRPVSSYSSPLHDAREVSQKMLFSDG